MKKAFPYVLAATLAIPCGAAAQEATFDSSATASEGTVTGQGRGRHRDVELVDYGRFRMPDRRDYKNLISIGWLFPVGATVRYDRLILDNFSVLGQLGFGSIKFGNTTWTSWRVAGGFNWHPIGNGMHGFFLGPRVQYTDWTLKYEDSEGVAKGGVSSIVASGIVGYRWIWDPGFSLGLGLGAAYRATLAEASVEYSDGTEASNVETDRASGLGFDMEFTLGWAF